MISLAFWLWCAAVAIGIAMATRFLSARHLMAARAVPAVHALFGLAGLAALIFGLSQGISQAADRYGTSAFAPAAAILVAIAAGFGLAAVLRGRPRGDKPGRNPGFLLAVHASLAVTAFVLLLGYMSLG